MLKDIIILKNITITYQTACDKQATAVVEEPLDAVRHGRAVVNGGGRSV